MSPPVKRRRSHRAGRVAAAGETHLRSYLVGAVPIINRLFERLRLREIIERHLPPEDARTKVPTSTGILLLVQVA